MTESPRALREARPKSFAFVPPKPINRPLHHYPKSLAAVGKEGWATVCFRVEADGTTSGITVIDSSRDESFVAAARKAAARYRFEPARIDGEPVPFEDNCVLLSFYMRDERRVTPSFYRRYEKINEHLEDGLYDDAKVAIDEALLRGTYTLVEQGALHWAEARYFIQREDWPAAARSLELALIFGSFDDDQELILRRLQFSVYAKSHAFVSALDVYESLQRDGVDIEPLDDDARRIRELVQSDASFAVQGSVDSGNWDALGCWRHTPARREFSLRRVRGAISEIFIMCELRSDSISFQEDVTWTIPSGWGACRLRVCGESGTSFELVEHGEPT